MNKSFAIFILLVISALWGAQFPVIKYLINHGLSAEEITFFRIFIGFFVLLACMLWKKDRFSFDIKFWVLAALLGVSGDFLAQYLIAIGQQTVTAGLSSILIASSPFFTFLLPYLIPGRKLKKPQLFQLVSLGFGLAGIVVMSYQSLKLSADIFGIACIIGAAFMFAVVNIVAEYARDYSGLSVSTAALLIMLVLLFPFNYQHLSSLSVSALPVLSGIVFLAVFCTAIAFLLMLLLAQGTDAVYLSYSNFLVPIFGILFAVILLGEEVRIEMLISIMLILIGITLLNLPRKEGASKACDAN
ncbi:DMT family transporter [Vibrio palustris]|uniref:Putative inner membrane transporter yiJE n=1 Tax=Vibrio palustris TaxID=1918946 RepID=A0A1R4B536_9VIBR|nr:DMT family transporter [Vibrio palustris]SJL84034.1 putative inner membrane transporter yiJE [Vibrio palustris]